MGKKAIYLLTFTLLSGLAYPQNSFDELITSGNKKIKEKNYTGAIENFENAKNIQSTDTAALNGLIKAYTLSEDYKSAQKQIDEALKYYPDNAEFVLRQGIIYNIRGLYDIALEEFTRALTLNPSSRITLQILLNRATSEFLLDDFVSALADYNKAIDMYPRNVSIYSYRGLVNFKLGNYLDAVNDYSNSIDLDPESPLNYYNRGMTYLKLSEKQKACIDFHKACKMGNINACKMIVTECGGK
ncbi:MAG: tetratricopeptide repeat protein [Bacteroidales bacterium]